MSEAIDAGKGAAPQQTVTPGAPATPPAGAGEGAGEGNGEGAGVPAFTPEQHAVVTKAQQEAADARRDAEFYQEQLAAAQTAQQAPEVDQEAAAIQSQFDQFASTSPVVKAQQAALQNQQAQLMDTQMRVRAAEFPHYAEVQQKVLAELQTIGNIPAANMDRAMKMVYASHAAPLVNARDTALAAENAQLKAYIATQQGTAPTEVDVGALQKAQGGAAAAEQAIPEPGPNATAAELGAYIDAMRVQRGY